ncbi:hypothetical protein [Fusobacterium nucleatum]|jgi:lipoprotein|uniref:hypothetical protein n=1 Tax=Fusobacterium nucleatum TaxID=851 RepID=UPI0030D40CD8
MKKWLFYLLAGLSILLIGCSNSTPQLSQMQIREMTTKEIQANFKTTFKATMSVLQDQDYIIENTDFNSGLIVAEKEVNKETTAGDVLMTIFVDPRHNRNGKVKVSATVASVSDNVTKLRINIQEKNIRRGTFGSVDETITNIQDKRVYEVLFNQISTEVERMKAMK